jgi:hypothetical protein
MSTGLLYRVTVRYFPFREQTHIYRALSKTPNNLSDATVILTAQTSYIRVLEFMIINSINERDLQKLRQILVSVYVRKEQILAWAAKK